MPTPRQFLFALLLLPLGAAGQSNRFSSAIRIGGLGDDHQCKVRALANGDEYVSGHFSSQITIGSTTLTSAGGDDIFLARRDAAGAWQWAVRIGSPSLDQVMGLDVFSNDDVGFSCQLLDDATVTGSGTTLTAGNYILRFDTSGNLVWSDPLNIPLAPFSLDLYLGSLFAIDPLDHIYMSFLLMEGWAVFGSDTAFVGPNLNGIIAAADASGNWLWACSAFAGMESAFYDVFFTPAGHAIAYGMSNGNSMTVIGTDTLYSYNAEDWPTFNFLADFDPSGNLMWTRQLQDAGEGSAWSIVAQEADGTICGTLLTADTTHVNGVALMASYADPDGVFFRIDTAGQ